MYDLVLAGGEAILPGKGNTSCEIGIKDGKIKAIAPQGRDRKSVV